MPNEEIVIFATYLMQWYYFVTDGKRHYTQPKIVPNVREVTLTEMAQLLLGRCHLSSSRFTCIDSSHNKYLLQLCARCISHDHIHHKSRFRNSCYQVSFV
jgi:hypothetical protein